MLCRETEQGYSGQEENLFSGILELKNPKTTESDVLSSLFITHQKFTQLEAASDLSSAIADEKTSLSTKDEYEASLAQKYFGAEKSGVDELQTIIDNSRWILDLHDDWDDEGSVGYKVETWIRAMNFLKNVLFSSVNDFCVKSCFPKISPADDGSIDLFWKQESFQLLINIPACESELLAYTGENKWGETISGRINTNRKNFNIAAWLNL